MREIKFRAWNIEDKEMIGNPSLWTDDFTNNINEYFIYWQKVVEENEKMVFMQYTGLKDKNGKEIYEGDILEWENWRGLIRGAVVWDNEKAMYFAKCGKYFAQGQDFHLTKIIGNIYENQELLKT